MNLGVHRVDISGKLHPSIHMPVKPVAGDLGDGSVRDKTASVQGIVGG